jgi:uncharacterized membrane protein
MSEVQEYDFNFFKPTSDFARANTKLIITIVVIWALAVFGFQFLLKAIEEPVPEEQLTAFHQIWPDVKDETASDQQLRELAGIYLNVFGRYGSLRSNEEFKRTFTATVYDLLPAHEKAAFIDLTKKDLPERKALISGIANSIGLEDKSIPAEVLPYVLVPYDGKPVDPLMMNMVPQIMEKHMVHNRSVLTDTKFLGFPFHYFYTANLLLVLFVVLCLIYCRLMDDMSVKYGMEEGEE